MELNTPTAASQRSYAICFPDAARLPSTDEVSARFFSPWLKSTAAQRYLYAYAVSKRARPFTAMLFDRAALR